MKGTLILGLVLVVFLLACPVQADFTSFIIRNDGSGNPPTIQASGVAPDALEFIIDGSGMKSVWGSNDINGATIGSITQLGITRHDDTTRFTAGSGPAVAPYFNIWVTDGAGNYAVVANEPSNPAFQPLFTSNGDGTKSYDLSFGDLADKTAKVYETPGWNDGTSWVHDMIGKTTLTFADVASLEIASPDVSYITDPANGVGSGAPDELDTYTAYGFNWVFGDTLSNYVSGEDGYIVSAPTAAAAVVPVPGSLALSLLGLSGVILRRRKS